jgi:two-component system sensor histidine kinase CreC
MIDKLLALAAVEHRQRIEQPEPVALAVLVDEAVAQVETEAAAAGVSLVRDDIDVAAVAEGDPFLLRQAIANLLDNAIDFAPPGSAIEVALQRQGDTLRVSVADRGPGVPDYAIGRVFERFYSLPRPDGGSRSSGLGLCFVAQVAGLHDGHAALANREGGGAVATLDLPLATAS